MRAETSDGAVDSELQAMPNELGGMSVPRKLAAAVAFSAICSCAYASDSVNTQDGHFTYKGTPLGVHLGEFLTANNRAVNMGYPTTTA